MLTDPSSPPALKARAAALLHAGRAAEARPLLEALCQQQVADAEAWCLLGMALGLLGQHPRCADCCQRAIALRPRYPEAHNSLGNALAALGRIPEAEAGYREALKLNERYADAHLNLAQVLHHQDRVAEAETQYRKFLRLTPDSVQAHFRLGLTLTAQGRQADAETAFRAALRLKPDYPEALNNLGTTLRARDRLAEAETAYRQALRLKPDYAAALVNLGIVLHLQERSEEAIASLTQALRLNPDSTEACLNLGNIYAQSGRLGEAIASYREALRLRPDSAEAYNNLFNVYSRRGELDEAIACYREARRLDPKLAASTYSALLFTLNYLPDWTPQAIFEEHRHWGETTAPRPESQPAHGNSREPERRLRIGYVTPDLRTHSVAYFLEPILAHHDRHHVEVFAYAELPPAKYDATSQRLQRLCDHWLDTCGLSDADLARRMRDDGIDILVDLAGHTAYNRLLAFAYRPAPVQVSYLGYVNTTGLPAMDYRLTDAWADPPGQECFYTEQLVRLPSGFLCYAPPTEAPAVASLPAAQAGHLTFGSFNNLAKIAPPVIAVWAQLLQALPTARLVVKSKPLKDPATAERLHRAFESHGVTRERIDLIDQRADINDHLGLYSRIDIGLDTFPYNGTTTTCEALWMGVPVISLAGDRHAGRVGVSLLSRVGLAELIAETPEEYVKLAVTYGGDPERLARLRANLRALMQNSSLCDAAAFTADLERTYRALWRAWCGDRANS